MTDTQPEVGWVAVCEDGETRHTGLFDTKLDAQWWANWGHPCTQRHTYRAVPADTGPT